MFYVFYYKILNSNGLLFFLFRKGEFIIKKMFFITENGSEYVSDGERTIRKKKYENGAYKLQPESTFMVYITVKEFLRFKKEFSKERVDLQCKLTPSLGLVPLEIWYSPKRNRQFLLHAGILTIFQPMAWMNGRDFHIGHEIIRCGTCESRKSIHIDVKNIEMN